MLGLFHEIGPCHIVAGQNYTKESPHSWTNIANVLFIESVILLSFITYTTNKSIVNQ